MSDAGLPERYRRLLRTFSPLWRRRWGELTLATLLDQHRAQGRTGPSLAERIAFLLAGIRTRLPGGSGLRPREHRSAGGGAAAKPSGPLSRALDAARGGFVLMNEVAPPLEVPLLRGGFLATAGLGAAGPVAAFPADPVVHDLDDLVRRRRSATVRLVIEGVALVASVALLALGTAPLLALALLLIAATAAGFDIAVVIRTGRRILDAP